MVRTTLIDVGFTIGLKVSLKSNQAAWEYPFATNLALNLEILPSGFVFNL